MKLIFQWLVAAIAIVIAAYLLPNVDVSSFVTALVVAVVLGALNLLVKPILILLTLPVNLLSLGLFTLVINAFLVWLGAAIVPGFEVGNFGWALVFAVVLSIINIVFRSMGREATRQPTATMRVNN